MAKLSSGGHGRLPPRNADGRLFGAVRQWWISSPSSHSLTQFFADLLGYDAERIKEWFDVRNSAKNLERNEVCSSARVPRRHGMRLRPRNDGALKYSDSITTDNATQPEPAYSSSSIGYRGSLTAQKEADFNWEGDYLWKCIVLGGFVYLFISIELLVISERAPVQSMVDHFFNLFEPVNDYLRTHPLATDIILLIDTLFLLACSGRLAVAILLQFLLRLLCMMVVEFPVPAKFIWRFPGFPPSATNDFFYSGHIGIPVATAMELSRRGRQWLSIGCHVLNVAQAAMMCILQVHYTADLITGVLAAIVSFNAAESVAGPFAYFFCSVGCLVKRMCGAKQG